MEINSWMQLKPFCDTVAEKVSKIPAPPVPDDGWGEKMRDVNRAVEGMQSILQARIEQEEEA
jgi:hypothetical protein